MPYLLNWISKSHLELFCEGGLGVCKSFWRSVIRRQPKLLPRSKAAQPPAGCGASGPTKRKTASAGSFPTHHNLRPFLMLVIARSPMRAISHSVIARSARRGGRSRVISLSKTAEPFVQSLP